MSAQIVASDLWDPEVNLGVVLRGVADLAWQSSRGWAGERNESKAKALGLYLVRAAEEWEAIYG